MNGCSELVMEGFGKVEVYCARERGGGWKEEEVR